MKKMGFFNHRLHVALLCVTATALSSCIFKPTIFKRNPNATSDSHLGATANVLSFSIQPSSSGTAGTALLIQPEVQVLSSSGSLVTSAFDNITLAAYTDAACTIPAGGTLTVGANPNTALNGVSDFTGVKYGLAGTIYLGASSPTATSACSGAITLTCVGGTPTNFFYVSGNNQTQNSWTLLTSNIVVGVTDCNAAPVVGQAVGFAVTSLDGSVGFASVNTDVAGNASNTWTLGNNSVVQTVDASLAGFNNITFTATALYPVSLAVADNGVVPAQFQVSTAGNGWPSGVSYDVLKDADASCNGGLTWYSSTTAAAGDPILLPSQGVLTYPHTYRVSFTLPSGELICSNAIDYHYQYLAGLTKIESSGNHSCGITAAGGVKCWGLGTSGQLGNNALLSSSNPVDVDFATPGYAGTVITKIALGALHTCAVSSLNEAYCWGSGANGRLGTGAVANKKVPFKIAGFANVTGITAGNYHTCIVTSGNEIYCWGANTSGQLGYGPGGTINPPVNGSNPVTGGAVYSAVAAGYYHTCGLTTGGAVKCWGYNTHGELGNNDATHTAANSAQDTGQSNIASISSGYYHSCSLSTTGAAQCWGWNNYGRIGDGTQGSTNYKIVPTPVSGMSSGVLSISAGFAHTCALLPGNTAKCWGYGMYGAIGDDTTATRITPTSITGINGIISQISAGKTQSQTCALTTTGYAYCWGTDAYGQLGDATFTQASAPLPMYEAETTLVSVKLGDAHGCGMTTGGGLKCWGSGATGRLGNGGVANMLTPTDVSTLTAGVTDYATGSGHTCAITAAGPGAVYCWGDNSKGQLGDNTVIQKTSPTPVCIDAGCASQLINAVSIYAGLYVTCAIMSDGSMKCWGYNGFGGLGDTTQTDRHYPVTVAGGFTFASAGVGRYTTCGILSGANAGALKCWGYNTNGSVGDGTTTFRTQPTDVVGLASGVTAVAVGYYTTCAQVGSGVKCWGSNSNGAIGDGTTTQRKTPTDVSGLTTGVTTLSLGSGDAAHFCAIVTGGIVKCWGVNNNGQHGDGSLNTHYTPVTMALSGSATQATNGGYGTCAVVGSNIQCAGHNATYDLAYPYNTSNQKTPTYVHRQVLNLTAGSGGYRYNCVLDSSNTLKCWGQNGSGQLGDGTYTNKTLPAIIMNNVSQVATGNSHACVLTTAGGVKCWGLNSSGQLGDGTTTTRNTAADVTGLTANVIAVTAGGTHSCAIQNTGAVVCWGGNNHGQLGDGTTTNQPNFITVVGAGGTSVSAGDEHTCAVIGAAAKCWGKNSDGQLGNNDATHTDSGAPVTAIAAGVSTVTAGGLHSCALLATGALKCWGNNDSGQLGTNNNNPSDTPVAVNGFAAGGASSINAGDSHTCIVKTAGLVGQCFGSNSASQVGNSSAVDVNTPTTATNFLNTTQFMGTGFNSGFGIKTTGSNMGYVWGDTGTSSSTLNLSLYKRIVLDH